MAERMKSPSGFIDKALTGGNGPSSGIDKKSIGKGQTLVSSFGVDNVKLAMDVPNSLRDSGGFAGGIENLKHSLTGTSAVQDKI